jgi:hypothetical protein
MVFMAFSFDSWGGDRPGGPGRGQDGRENVGQVGVAQLTHLVAGLADRTANAQDPAQADRGAGHDHVAVGGVDGGSQLLDLALPVAHRRHDQPDAPNQGHGLTPGRSGPQ